LTTRRDVDARLRETVPQLVLPVFEVVGRPRDEHARALCRSGLRNNAGHVSEGRQAGHLVREVIAQVVDLLEKRRLARIEIAERPAEPAVGIGDVERVTDEIAELKGLSD
jgi:hypothetical protein